MFSQNGNILKESSYRIEGELNFDFIDMGNINLVEEGYPIGMIWKPKGADKVWSLLDDGERISYGKSMIETINGAIDEIFK